MEEAHDSEKRKGGQLVTLLETLLQRQTEDRKDVAKDSQDAAKTKEEILRRHEDILQRFDRLVPRLDNLEKQSAQDKETTRPTLCRCKAITPAQHNRCNYWTRSTSKRTHRQRLKAHMVTLEPTVKEMCHEQGKLKDTERVEKETIHAQIAIVNKHMVALTDEVAQLLESQIA
jgi:hypothetical protein